MHVLIIEDNPVLGRGIETALARWSHTSEWARDGDAGLTLALVTAFDLVLLDLGLPRRNGLDVLREMRRHGVQTPVIVITARDDIGDRVGGLDAGADDYLVKPFHLDELSARLRALHRRAHGLAHRLIEVGGLRLDTMSSEASYRENPLDLSRMEFLVLRALAERAGRVVTRTALEQAMYGTGGVESNALEVHIHALRRKLAPSAIRTVRGLGYLLVREGAE
jgi:DNA-binding response OmpR family regulator